MLIQQRDNLNISHVTTSPVQDSETIEGSHKCIQCKLLYLNMLMQTEPGARGYNIITNVMGLHKLQLSVNTTE